MIIRDVRELSKSREIVTVGKPLSPESDMIKRGTLSVMINLIKS